MSNFNPNSLKIFNNRFDAGKFNKLVDALLRQRLRSGPNYSLSEGSGGTIILPLSPSSIAGGWPYKVYNTSSGATGQVQINGGDGFVATLNGLIANVNGSPNNISPYPQLSVTGNGYIYAYVVLDSSGNITSLDCYYAGTVPSPDSSVPPLHASQVLASITAYTVTDGRVSFMVSNVTNYGFTSLQVCGNTVTIF